MSAFEIGISEQYLHIGTLRILRKNSADLGDGLRVQLALHVHVSKRAARHADLGRFHAIASAVQSLQFALNGGIGRLRFKSALHMPDGIIHFVLFIVDDAQTDMGYKIARCGHEHTSKNIHSFPVSLALKKGLAQHAIGFKVLWERF